MGSRPAFRRPALHGAAPAFALALLLAAPAARAADRIDETRAPAGPRLTLERTAWPAERTALDGRPRIDATDLAWRWWLRRGPAQFGFGVGAVGRPAGLPGETAPSIAWSASTLTLGLRWRLGTRSMLYADASDARPADRGGDLYATRLGVEWAGRSPSRFGFDKGAFGLRLDSGYRMSLRLRHGGLALYLRSQF